MGPSHVGVAAADFEQEAERDDLAHRVQGEGRPRARSTDHGS